MRTLPVFAATLLLFGCGSPLAGGWRGTADLGPVLAPALEFHVAEDTLTGRLELQEVGKPYSRFQLCALRVDAQDERKVELEYDANRPGCEATHQDVSDRRRLVGVVGEGVWTGDVFRGAEKIGFFRAFQLDADAGGTHPPSAAPAAPPKPSPI